MALALAVLSTALYLAAGYRVVRSLPLAVLATVLMLATGWAGVLTAWPQAGVTLCRATLLLACAGLLRAGGGRTDFQSVPSQGRIGNPSYGERSAVLLSWVGVTAAVAAWANLDASFGPALVLLVLLLAGCCLQHLAASRSLSALVEDSGVRQAALLLALALG